MSKEGFSEEILNETYNILSAFGVDILKYKRVVSELLKGLNNL
jgi:hypothetical protein